ncbi:hypothetical protein [Lewinella sp. W8]|uniref:hypothetical protein n=1 Tax=Lewinella sp. W8 TaxID=2528208 RepID=UPI001067FAA1|nr:hypothetical protein [Lewinella sp. W8]MTB50460.1 hypothetical protein [Lewinella sp. W8]
MRLRCCLLLIACGWIAGCEKNDLVWEPPPLACNPIQIFREEQVSSFTSDELSILSLSAGDECLTVSFRAARCEESNWELSLAASSLVLGTDPPERSIRFLLNNAEGCPTVEQGVAEFDVTSLRLAGESTVILNVVGTDLSVAYNF